MDERDYKAMNEELGMYKEDYEPTKDKPIFKLLIKGTSKWLKKTEMRHIIRDCLENYNSENDSDLVAFSLGVTDGFNRAKEIIMFRLKEDLKQAYYAGYDAAKMDELNNNNK